MSPILIGCFKTADSKKTIDGTTKVAKPRVKARHTLAEAPQYWWVKRLAQSALGKAKNTNQELSIRIRFKIASTIIPILIARLADVAIP